MKVKDVCTREVRSCRRMSTLADAAEIFRTAGCGALPVVEEDGRLAGILTDRDICLAGASRPVPLSAIRVGDVMTGAPHTCGLEEDLLVAVEEMGRRQVRRLPVVDAEGHLQGLLSLADVVRVARAGGIVEPGRPTFADLAQVLRSICGSRRRHGERRAQPMDPFMA